MIKNKKISKHFSSERVKALLCNQSSEDRNVISSGSEYNKDLFNFTNETLWKQEVSKKPKQMY